VAEIPFKLTVYNKSFVRQGWVGDPVRLEVVARHNAVGNLGLTLRSNSPKVALLMDPGTRLVCEYEGNHLLSGPVRTRGGSSNGEINFSVVDDFRLFQRVLGWPSPTSSLSTTALGTQPAEYDTRSGPAENVAKAFVRANAVTRLGLPVTVEADGGRGDSITVAMRFHPLYDRLFPAVDGAGVGLSVKQQGSGLYVSAYVPTSFPRVLSEAAGVVQEWAWTNSAPEATRGVVGGQGEATARNFLRFTKTALETEWGDTIEVFRDARDTGALSVYTERANETLDETAEKSGLSVRFSETMNFRYGQGFKLGDEITLKVGPNLTITDLLREVKMTWTQKDGLVTQPLLGEVQDDPDVALAKALRKNATDIRNLRSR
jgi:hypothetical protein